MSLKLSDLPPAMRKQVEAKTGAKPKRSKRQLPGSSQGSCHTEGCGWTGSASAFEKHSDAEEHHRFDISLEPS